MVYNNAELNEVSAMRARKLAAQTLQRSQVERKPTSGSCCNPMCCFTRKGAVDHASEDEEEPIE
jgi:hypothetical protein